MKEPISVQDDLQQPGTDFDQWAKTVVHAGNVESIDPGEDQKGKALVEAADRSCASISSYDDAVKMAVYEM